MSLLQLLNLPLVSFAATTAPYYHPGRSSAVLLGSHTIGHYGEIHPRILKEMDIQGTIMGCELYIDALPGQQEVNKVSTIPVKKHKVGSPRTYPETAFQPIIRDLAFWVDHSVTAQDLVECVRKTERGLIAAVDVFDMYDGDKAPAGKKSLALEVTFIPKDRSLTLEELAQIQEKIALQVANKLQGQLRDS